MSNTGITFGLLKKVVQTYNHTSTSFVSVAATATISAIIITTSTTR